jgi:hypothetical protein
MVRLRVSRLSLGLLVLGSGLFAARAEAGIIILKNGRVFIGRIDPSEDDKGGPEDGFVTMHEPKLYKGAPPLHGKEDFPKHDIRWWDPVADEPTDDYMKDHADEPIDPRYLPYIERWKDRKNNELTIDPKMFMPATGMSGKLSPIPIPDKWGADEISIRKPAGWTSKKVNGIFIFESDQKGTEGFVPRIHVFSVERSAAAPSDQALWIKQEIEKLSQNEPLNLKEGSMSPKPSRNGFDLEWITATHRGNHEIMAVRQVHFRDHRTYFVSCYAHESEFDGLAMLFRACMQSLVITEGGAKGATANDRIDSTGVKVGQVYRWKSATVPDQRTWEVTALDTASVTRKATTTAADGQKTTSESPESLAPLDPVARIGAIAGAPVSPGRTGTEQLTVSGQTFECDIFEATANNKKFKVWLSKKFPITLKVTVDGAIVEELAEIK